MAKIDKTPVIGIDLGTNSSFVSVFRDGKVEIINDDQGTKSIPNCVAFTEVEHLIGPAAVKQAIVNPKNTIFIAKRLIGRCFNEISFLTNGKHCPLLLVCSSINKALIQVEYRRFVRYFCPEEISSFVLRQLKEKAEKYLDCKVKNAVVTVPANFNDAQRQATVDAARIAGLHVMKLLNEPTAVALAYGLEKDIFTEKNIMIFDLGAGSFDVSVISIEQRTQFRVKATAGSSLLGGIDFDNKLVDYFVEEFNNQNERDIRQSIYSITRLHTVCEQIKRTLSFTTEATVELKSLFDDIDFTLVISRETFETICSDIFKSILGFAEQALREAKLEKCAIDDVVLVGGSARIPMIQKSLQEFMHGKKLNTFINPDEVVAYGAAVQAAVFSEDVDNMLKDITVVDVNPLSIGIESCGGVMAKLINSNSTLPYEISNVFTTTFDDQSSLIFRIFEGERLMTKDNHCLGRFELSNIPLAPKGTQLIKVRFRMDVNGIIHLSVADKSNDTFNKIKFFFDKGRLIIEEILKMSNDAEKFKVEDEKERQRHAARSKLEEYLLYVKERVEPDTYKLTEKERLTAIAQYQEIFFWIDKTPFLNPNHYNKKLEEATRIFFYVIEKLNAPSPTPPLPSSTPSKTGSSRSHHSSSSHRKESVSPTGTSAASSPSATSSREKFA